MQIRIRIFGQIFKFLEPSFLGRIFGFPNTNILRLKSLAAGEPAHAWKLPCRLLLRHDAGQRHGGRQLRWDRRHGGHSRLHHHPASQWGHMRNKEPRTEHLRIKLCNVTCGRQGITRRFFLKTCVEEIPTLIEHGLFLALWWRRGGSFSFGPAFLWFFFCILHIFQISALP